MKEKILLFIIGLLLGAVITTGAFFVYTKATTCNNTNSNTQMQMPGGTPPSMQNGEGNSNGQPPEKPDGDNGQQEKPGENSTQEENQSSNS